MAFSLASIRSDFPALHQEVHPGKKLVYLDSAATALKPQSVIDAVVSIYAQDCANVHRGVHALSQRATARVEAARDLVQHFIGAEAREEVVFTRGTTDAINLVAQTWGRANLKAGDEVLVAELDHHSNIVSWQLVCEATGATLKPIPMNDRGEVTVEAFEACLSDKTKVCAFPQVSNSLGTLLPIRQMIELAHSRGAITLVDGAQGIVHSRVNVQELGADFYTFSAHKLYGPTGIGVLYGKRALLEAMPPWQGGGDMIDRVRFEGSTYNDLPFKFEAGTPHIAGVVGLGAAIEYLNALDLDAALQHEADVHAYAIEALETVDGLTLLGKGARQASVLSFVLEGVHPTDAGSLLDARGIAIRTGHHCAQPVMDHFGITGTARASLAIYSGRDDIDALVDGLKRACRMLRR